MNIDIGIPRMELKAPIFNSLKFLGKKPEESQEWN